MNEEDRATTEQRRVPDYVTLLRYFPERLFRPVRRKALKEAVSRCAERRPAAHAAGADLLDPAVLLIGQALDPIEVTRHLRPFAEPRIVNLLRLFVGEKDTVTFGILFEARRRHSAWVAEIRRLSLLPV